MYTSQPCTSRPPRRLSLTTRVRTPSTADLLGSGATGGALLATASADMQVAMQIIGTPYGTTRASSCPLARQDFAWEVLTQTQGRAASCTARLGVGSINQD